MNRLKINKTPNTILTALAVVFVLGVLTFVNYRFSIQNPGGTDFMVHWMGTRAYLTEGLSPYSDETSIMIQTFTYGRPAQAGEHELRVAYPLYSIFLFMPFSAFADFDIARGAWMTLLEISLIALCFVCFQLTDWKPSLPVLTVFLIFSVLWYHAVRPLILGNAVILVALAIAGGLLAIKRGADELAGILFALATIKPQVALLFVVFIIFWAAATSRWKIIGWFLGVMALLVATATLLIPDWILQNIREILRYPGYNPPGTLGAALNEWLPGAGRRIGWAVTGVLSLLLLLEWNISRVSNKRGFVWAACLTLTASLWIGIQTDPGNFIVAFPAIVMCFSLLDKRWKNGGKKIIYAITAILFIGIWTIFLLTVEYSYQPIQSPVMFIPLPMALLLMLYWVRWWAIRPASTWMDSIYELENPDLE
jgi:hypothetical protein